MKTIRNLFRGLFELFISTVYYRTPKVYFSNHFTIGMYYVIKKKCVFPHPVGIVIGSQVVLGNNCRIYQNTTIGTKDIFSTSGNSKYPHIGNNVTICPNCVVVGEIEIGDNVIIGPNTYVDKSVPENSIAYGSPLVIKSMS